MENQHTSHEQQGCVRHLRHQAELEAMLASGGVDTLQWGQHKAKTVAHLWREIVEGETHMQEHPLQRIVRGVVEVMVQNGGRTLIETQQAFSDGLIRSRQIPPAEKMQPGERPVDTAIRCLREELAVDPSAVEIVDATHEARHEIQLSPSYPGLETRYTFHRVDVRVDGLPDDDFSTDEYSSDGTELRLRHSWSWQSLPEPRATQQASLHPDIQKMTGMLPSDIDAQADYYQQLLKKHQ